MRLVAFCVFAITCTAFGGLANFVGFPPQPYLEADRLLKISLYVVTALYVLGPVVYAMGWPERLRPASWTDYLGASHQIMHACVLGGALVNGWCMERTRTLRPELNVCDD